VPGMPRDEGRRGALDAVHDAGTLLRSLQDTLAPAL